MFVPHLKEVSLRYCVHDNGMHKQLWMFGCCWCRAHDRQTMKNRKQAKKGGQDSNHLKQLNLNNTEKSHHWAEVFVETAVRNEHSGCRLGFTHANKSRSLQLLKWVLLENSLTRLSFLSLSLLSEQPVYFPFILLSSTDLDKAIHVFIASHCSALCSHSHLSLKSLSATTYSGCSS